MQTILLLSLIAVGNEPAADDFTDVQIREPYRSYLLADPLLMQVTGAKLIELGNGRRIVMAVASVVPESTAPRHRLEAERVCRVKAMAHIIARRNPVQVVHSEQVKERVIIRIENGREHAGSTSEVLETIRTRVEGTTQDLPVVGRWLSHDRSTLYLAVGTVIDRSGDPIPFSRLHRPVPPSTKASLAASGVKSTSETAIP